MSHASHEPRLGQVVRRRLRSLPRLTWLVAALAVAPAAAQPSPDGQLVGVVRDATGGVLAGAVVTVESPALVGGRRRLETSRDGTWRLAAAPAGAYRVTVGATGFRDARQDGIAIAAGQTLTLDVTLALAGELLDAVRERFQVDLENLWDRGIYADFAEIIKGEAEAHRMHWLYLDMTDEAVILFDRGGFFHEILQSLRGRLRALGARRRRLGRLRYWDLKPDFVPGEVITL